MARGLMAETITRVEDEPLRGPRPRSPDEDGVKWRKRTVKDRLFPEPHRSARIGRFIVLGTLGSGGMGSVLRAHDETLDRQVAVKLMHPGVHEQHDRRMLREAQALARLSHPNVVQVYEVGEVDGQLFIAMELVTGQTLDRWQDEHRSWRSCLDAYVQAGRGLAAAHAAGMVHRDFKPSNCIMDEEGRVRVLDFGLARHTESAEDEPEHLQPGDGARERPPSSGAPSSALDEKITQTGSVLGTIAYMAPEQMKGEETDARADQYSFCVSLFEALVGRRPIPGEGAHARSNGDSSTRGSRGRSPRWLIRMLERGLALDPDARWPSMTVLLDRLERGRRRRSLGWVGAGASMVGLSLAGAMLTKDELPVLPDPCIDAAEPMAEVWGDEPRARVRRAILAPQLSYGSQTWASVESQLDGYADAIGSAYVDACEATKVRHELTLDDLRLRRECLGQRVGTLRQTLAVLGEADEGVVENAVTMVVSLPDVGACAEPTLPPQAGAVQEAPGHRALRERLQQARALIAAGKATEGLVVARQATASATELGASALSIEAQLVEGEGLAELGRHEPAAKSLRGALLGALELELDALAIEALYELVYVVGVDQARGDAGAWLGAMAEALVLRRSVGAQARARVLTSVGQLASARGDHAMAQAKLERAVTLLRELWGEDHISLAEPLDGLGVALRHQGKDEQAREQYRRALDIRIRWQGPEHPASAHQRINLGVVLDALGQADAAQDQYRRALAVLMLRPSEHLDRQAHARTSLGFSLANQRRIDEAVRELSMAVDAWTASMGPEHPWVAQARLSLAGVLRGARRFEEAAGEYERALVALSATEPTPARDTTTIAVLDGLAKSLDALGRGDEAERCRARIEELSAKRR